MTWNGWTRIDHSNAIWRALEGQAVRIRSELTSKYLMSDCFFDCERESTGWNGANRVVAVAPDATKAELFKVENRGAGYQLRSLRTGQLLLARPLEDWTRVISKSKPGPWNTNDLLFIPYVINDNPIQPDGNYNIRTPFFVATKGYEETRRRDLGSSARFVSEVYAQDGAVAGTKLNGELMIGEFTEEKSLYDKLYKPDLYAQDPERRRRGEFIIETVQPPDFYSWIKIDENKQKCCMKSAGARTQTTCKDTREGVDWATDEQQCDEYIEAWCSKNLGNPRCACFALQATIDDDPDLRLIGTPVICLASCAASTAYRTKAMKLQAVGGCSAKCVQIASIRDNALAKDLSQTCTVTDKSGKTDTTTTDDTTRRDTTTRDDTTNRDRRPPVPTPPTDKIFGYPRRTVYFTLIGVLVAIVMGTILLRRRRAAEQLRTQREWQMRQIRPRTNIVPVRTTPITAR